MSRYKEVLTLKEPAFIGFIYTDLKPQNFLMKIREPDQVINHELVTRPAVIYEAPKTASFIEVGYCPVQSLPLPLAIEGDRRELLFEVVISDFGHAHFDDQYLSKIVQPSALRAPEVALGLTWDKAIDIWSLGCLVSILPSRWYHMRQRIPCRCMNLQPAPGYFVQRTLAKPRRSDTVSLK